MLSSIHPSDGVRKLRSSAGSRPRISVVVPFHNEERHLPLCIDALLGQTFPPEHREILMVDSGSRDGSVDLVARHPQLRLLSVERPGAYRARNHGLDQARGEIIAFTDADCAVEPGWLESIDRAFEDSSVGVVLGQRSYQGQHAALRAIADYEEAKARYVFESDDPLLYFAYTNNMAARARYFEGHRFVDRRRGADTIWLRGFVDQHSCGAVRHLPSMRVRHLEIRSLTDYFRKMFVYGRSRRLYRSLCATRSLTSAERWRVLRRAGRRKPFLSVRSALLLALLSLGLLAWTAGGLSAAFARHE